MSTQLNIKDRFTETHDGFPSISFSSSSEYHNFEWQLKFANLSFKTKILKTKKYGREFIVMLVENHGGPPTQELVTETDE
jgi:hypothetical protein